MKPDSCLFSLVRLGDYTLPNRMVVTSESRLLARDNLPQPDDITYYANRASCGLIITEPTLVSQDETLPNYPGIYNHQQVQCWRNITETVRKNRGKIFLQLWYNRRINIVTDSTKTSLTSLFRSAAQNALAADFDGVEIYLNFDILVNSDKKANNKYHRDLENRMQLILAIFEEVASVWNEERVGIKLGLSQDKIIIQKDNQDNIEASFYYLIDGLNFYNLAYLHLTEPILETYCKKGIYISCLNLLNSIYTGRIIIDCQDSLSKAKDVIINYRVDLVSFNNYSILSI